MDNTRSETWEEIKNGLGVAFQILIYSFVGFALVLGVGYVYFTCCQ